MGFVTLLRELLTEDELHSWGWRIPFLASVILGIIGLYLRSNLHESEAFTRVKERGLTDGLPSSHHFLISSIS
jgi:MFS family permease